MNSFRDVIALWRTPDVMAQEISFGRRRPQQVSISAARHWKTRDFIPCQYWELVLAAAHKKGASVDEKDFTRWASILNGGG